MNEAERVIVGEILPSPCFWMSLKRVIGSVVVTLERGNVEQALSACFSCFAARWRGRGGEEVNTFQMRTALLAEKEEGGKKTKVKKGERGDVPSDSSNR